MYVCTVLTDEKCMYGTRGGGGNHKNKKNTEIYQAIQNFF